MEKEAPYQLVRDALGFYKQVPIEIPEVDVVHEAIVPVMEVKSEAVVPRKLGRPRKRLNADFEVDV